MNPKGAPLSYVLLLLLLLSHSFPTSSQISGSNSISYHIYPMDGSTTSSSCNPYDPATLWGGYVTASVVSGVQCGMCVKMTSSAKYGGNTIYVVRIDIGGQGFDLNQPAFNEMCGQQGYLDGHCDIDWVVVDNKYCNDWISQHGAQGTAYYGGSSDTGVSAPPPSSSGTSGSTNTVSGGNSADCGAGYVCTSVSPGQNSAVDWESYCAQMSGGQSFCMLGASSCACIPVVSQAVSETSSSSSSSSKVNVGAWVGIGLAVGLTVTVILAAIAAYVRWKQNQQIL